ncbi:MAG: diaminopimelate epimerase [Dehalococcoidia bacterium]|nr:diaminopimelate epimerase [Dehalococcoidia bacterium]
MRFTKLQGLGNDFVLLDGRGNERDWAQLAVAMCRQHFGVGSDGLLVLQTSEKADFLMRMFNPDGTESEACGNGLRCFVRYLADNVVKDDTKELKIETLAGVRQTKLIEDSALIQVAMGQPEFSLSAIPVAADAGCGKTFDIMTGDWPLDVHGRRLMLNFVSMGNPHAVYFTDEPVGNFPLEDVGLIVATHPLFPKGANFEVARALDSHKIEVRVWERGAGETLACGSGACAVAVAAQLRGLCADNVEILLPGGSACVEWSKGKDVLLTGPAEVVFSGEWPE